MTYALSSGIMSAIGRVRHAQNAQAGVQVLQAVTPSPTVNPMNSRILSILSNEGLECLPRDHVYLDSDQLVEYRYRDERPAEDVFESPPPAAGYQRVPQMQSGIPSILRYFLDGSRRTYRVADIIRNGKYLPLIAAQVGVAVVERAGDGERVRPLRKFCRFENVLAMPANMASKEDLGDLEQRIAAAGLPPFVVLRYDPKPEPSEQDPVDLGVARIMSYLQDLEISTVRRMASEQLLGSSSVLVKDGPLQYLKALDVVQFRNVVGLSKTFRPNFAVGRSRRRQDVGSLTARLSFGERTAVYKPADVEKTIGMWYLRIRPPERMQNPLQGIVKLECYAVDPEEIADGLGGARVDGLSAHVLRERNVTPYGADTRWASHIYPVYLAETYLKSSFMSDLKFRALF